MITEEELKIFDRYGGDIDAISKSGRNHEKVLFGSNEWSLIDNFYQDIELINKHLVAQSYIDEFLVKLRNNCDDSSFKIFTREIEFYESFQKVVEILRQIEVFINPDSDTVWPPFNSIDQFLIDLRQNILDIQNCNFSTLEKIRAEFLPTSAYQEISISSGWGDNFLRLASDYDKLYEQINNKKQLITHVPKPRQTWLQKILAMINR